MEEQSTENDVFISYASEDRDSVAIPLAEILTSRGLKVWIDKVKVRTGDSFRRSIDKGLASSRYGIAILSQAYFAKEWTQKELDAMLAMETSTRKVVLPVWHNIGLDMISSHSPILAARNAVSTRRGLNFVAQELLIALEKAKTEDQLEGRRFSLPDMSEAVPMQHLSSSKAIGRLYELLSEHDVTPETNIKTLGRKIRNHMDASMYGWFAAYRNALLGRLQDETRLDFCLGWGKRGRGFSEKAAYGTAVKKLSVMSGCAVLAAPTLRAPGAPGKVVPDAWYELIIGFRPLIESGMLLVMPRSMTQIKSEGVRKSEGVLTAGLHPGIKVKRQPRTWEEEWFLLGEKLPSLTIVDLSKKALATQMYELDPSQRLAQVRPIYIYLPQLLNVTQQTLVDLREHHGEAFSLYNATITTFFRESSLATTEGKILEIMKKTDERIREIEKALTKVSKSATLQVLGIGVESAVASALCAFSGSDVAPLIAALAASRAITRGLSYFRLRATRESIVSGDTFYFPWLLHQESL